MMQREKELVTLRFEDMRQFGHFVRSLNCGYQANIMDQTVAGNFPAELVQAVCLSKQATLVGDHGA